MASYAVTDVPHHAAVHILQILVVFLCWLQKHLIQNLRLHRGLGTQHGVTLPDHMVALETDGWWTEIERQTETGSRRGGEDTNQSMLRPGQRLQDLVHDAVGEEGRHAQLHLAVSRGEDDTEQRHFQSSMPPADT